MTREAQYQRGVGLLWAVAIVALSWAIVALLGGTANPGILLGPVLIGGFNLWRGRP